MLSLRLRQKNADGASLAWVSRQLGHPDNTFNLYVRWLPQMDDLELAKLDQAAAAPMCHSEAADA